MTNSQVCHKWVYNPQTSWHNNSSNMSYGNYQLYSYSSILAIHRDGVIHIDDRIANYSNSSSKQTSHLYAAIPSYVTVFKYDFSAKSALHWYLEQCMYFLDKQSRARKAAYTHTICRYLDHAMQYIELYGADKRKAVYKNLTKLDKNRNDMLSQFADVIEASNKARLAAKRKEDKSKQSQRQANLGKFTGGGVLFDPNYTGVYLRRIEDKLQTTNHITVNFKEAQIMYNRWNSGKNIIGLKLEHYTVVSATKNAVKIGCTLIGKKELDRIFKEI